MMQCVRQSLAHGLSHVHARMPPTFVRAVDRLARHGAALMRPRLPILQFDGSLAQAGDPTRVVVVDDQPCVSYFVQPLFDDAPVASPTAVGASWLGLSAALDRLAAEADLLMVRLPRGLGRLRLDDRYLRVPEAVACRAEVPADGALPARARRSQSRNLRLLRRARLGWRVSHRREDFERFYESMYVPFARQRFGAQASTRSRPRLLSSFLRGGLMWIVDERDEVLGGLIYSVERDALVSVAAGTAGGDVELLKRGVMPATDAFAFELAHRLGLRYCDMGLSRPCLTDGVLRYKSRWGAVLGGGGATPYELFVRWDRFNAAVGRLLHRLPLIVDDGVGLAGLGACAAEVDRAAAAELAGELVVPGLRGMWLIAPGCDAPVGVELPAGHGLTLVGPGSSGQISAWLCRGAGGRAAASPVRAEAGTSP